MTSRDLNRMMWSEALTLLEQADRLHRQFCRPAAARASVWEPPIDVIETADAVLVHVALPGASAESVRVEFQPEAIIVTAQRFSPLGLPANRPVRVHALEIPYGRFERRIGLPVQSLFLEGTKLQDGCFTLTFSKKMEAT